VPDVDAVIVGTGPAGATAADVLTSAGWSVIMLEKGSNHLLALDPPFAGLGHVSNDEIKFFRRHFLGPDPFLEPRTYRRDDTDGDHLFAGEVNNLPSHPDAVHPRHTTMEAASRPLNKKRHSELHIYRRFCLFSHLFQLNRARSTRPCNVHLLQMNAISLMS
jgi:choline dehydrogenase-like flavoprotein